MEVTLGKIVATYGIKGEVKILSCSDFASKRYKKGNEVILHNTLTNERVSFKVASFHKYKNLDIVSFEGYQDINMIEKYIGYEVLIEKPENDLNKNQYYYADLLGCSCIYNSKEIGKVVDILDSGKQQLLRIEKEDRSTILYPFIEVFVESVDIENKQIVLKPIEGMI